MLSVFGCQIENVHGLIAAAASRTSSIHLDHLFQLIKKVSHHSYIVAVLTLQLFFLYLIYPPLTPSSSLPSPFSLSLSSLFPLPSATYSPLPSSHRAGRSRYQTAIARSYWNSSARSARTTVRGRRLPRSLSFCGLWPTFLS